MIPSIMTAMAIAAPGGPEMLRPEERAVPKPGPGEVLVKVAAAGVNRVDVLQRTGIYTPPPGTTDIPGVEFAGHVVSLGAGAARYAIGDRVCGIVVGGAYAPYVASPEMQTLPVPERLNDVAAGAVAETFFTVWTALMEHGRFAAGESVLIHGGGSGIGTTAIMLARAMGAGAVFTTAGSAEKCAVCERLGATRAIDYRQEDFQAVVHDATSGRGVDIVIDIVGGDYIARNITLLADDGRLVFVGRMSQQTCFTANMLRIMYSRLVITGVSLRGQSAAQKARIAQALETRVWPLLASGQLAPLVDSVFDLADAAAAHRRLEASAHTGKIVLRC
jgi:NADPH2:quinone reductase